MTLVDSVQPPVLHRETRGHRMWRAGTGFSSNGNVPSMQQSYDPPSSFSDSLYLDARHHTSSSFVIVRQASIVIASELWYVQYVR